MATGQMSEVIQHLRRTLLLADGAHVTDEQLLEDFIERRDEAAIAALVRRHGPMVWGVCRRVLRNHHDAEDAFQATFLVLVRKADSIASREMLANWLYGVARQTALKARATATRRKGRERQVPDAPEPAVDQPELSFDLRPLLDDELSRLPDRYRVVIALCDLEGRTRREVAQQLRVPEGTVAGHLARARTMLAKRLARRGVTVSGGLVGVVLSAQSAWASVPSTVVSRTLRAATQFAAGEATAGAVSATVVALAQGVIKAMHRTKLKTACLLLMMSTLALTTAMLASARPHDEGSSAESPAVQAEKPAAQAKQNEPPKEFTNALGMKFVWIAPGTFLMGTPQGEERGQFVHDETQHKVTLTKGYYMGVYPVTQEQWQEVMGNNPSKFKGEKNLPVDNLSWNDCQEFIEKLRAKTKDHKPYRLPTEAEREYACRAGTTTPFSCGETISTDQANYDGNGVYGNGKRGVDRGRTTPVGSFPPNAWGLYDMHGNVGQWVQDWLGDYPKTDVVDPQGPATGKLRVTRGGSWYGHPQYVRSAFRYAVEPGIRHERAGFRICFSPD